MVFLFCNFQFQKRDTMINKKVEGVSEALIGVSDNMTFMLGGFGFKWYPRKLNSTFS